MMAVFARQFSDKSVAKSTVKLSTKEAWARYAEIRWPTNRLSAVQIEWDLTEGEARGLIYGQASLPTIDKIIDHKRGGFSVGLEVLCLRKATDLERYLNSQLEDVRRERDEAKAREHRLKSLKDRLSSAHVLDRRKTL